MISYVIFGACAYFGYTHQFEWVPIMALICFVIVTTTRGNPAFETKMRMFSRAGSWGGVLVTLIFDGFLANLIFPALLATLGYGASFLF